MYKVKNKLKDNRRFIADGVPTIIPSKKHIFVRALQRDVEEYEKVFEITIDDGLVETGEKQKTKKVKSNGNSR